MKTIYHNGRVYTGAPAPAQAFAVENGRFVYAGSDAGALALRRPGDETVDLGGQFVCPGFNDSHMHLLEYGYLLRMPQLAAHTGSLADMLECMRAFLAQHPRPDGGWLVGRGWNQDLFADVRRMPDRYDLDAVSTEIPVAAVRACGHCMVVNSRALALLGVTGSTPQPAGGRIGMRDGEPDGRFFDNAMDPVYAAIPAPGKAELKEMIRTACRALNAQGITSCQSDDYSIFRAIPYPVVDEAFRELAGAGQLTVRVNEQCNFAGLDALEAFIAAGGRTGRGDDFYRTGPVKIIGDGALGARTALLSRPYADAPGVTGLPLYSRQELTAMIGCAHAHGLQTATHAIGDACLDWVLDALEAAMAAHPRPDCRHGIVHCQITRPEQLERIAALGLHVYAQSIFLDYDIRIVEARAGRELAASSYSWKTLLDRGVTVSNGSDCPVETPCVMAGIQCAVTRRTLGGLGPYLPRQAFTLRQALDSYTVAGARASFEEGCKGRIAPGFLADFTVLGQDPFALPAEALHAVPVTAVCLGGREVFRAG